MKKPFGRYSVEGLRKVEEDHFDLTEDIENACPHQILHFYLTFSKIFAVFASPIGR